jgi:hypothetical protein
VTLSRGHLNAIGRAVQKVGGDLIDAGDLVAAWERLEADTRGRVERMRYEAAHVRCCCADDPDPVSRDGRCSRCWGWPR